MKKLLRDMKLLNYENIKNKLLAPCQFHPKRNIKISFDYYFVI
jgi:hypothetical protein